MSDEIVVTVETPEEPAAEAIVEAESVIEQAIELAGIIDEARQEGQQETEVVTFSLQFLAEKVMELQGMIENLTDEIATLTALEVAEIVVEEPPAVVEEVAAVEEELAPLEDVVIEPEVVEPVNEPAPRIQKRKRTFI
jgi:hypothetical protein